MVRAHPGTVIVKQVFVEWMSKYIKKKKKECLPFPSDRRQLDLAAIHFNTEKSRTFENTHIAESKIKVRT